MEPSSLGMVVSLYTSAPLAGMVRSGQITVCKEVSEYEHYSKCFLRSQVGLSVLLHCISALLQVMDEMVSVTVYPVSQVKVAVAMSVPGSYEIILLDRFSVGQGAVGGGG